MTLHESSQAPLNPNPRFPETLQTPGEPSDPIAAAEQVVEGAADLARRSDGAVADPTLPDETAWMNGHQAAADKGTIEAMERQFSQEPGSGDSPAH